MYRLSYERRGDISFIAGETISNDSERGTKYDIVTRAIKLILPSLECDNLFITYLCWKNLWHEDSKFADKNNILSKHQYGFRKKQINGTCYN